MSSLIASMLGFYQLRPEQSITKTTGKQMAIGHPLHKIKQWSTLWSFVIQQPQIFVDNSHFQPQVKHRNQCSRLGAHLVCIAGKACSNFYKILVICMNKKKFCTKLQILHFNNDYFYKTLRWFAQKFSKFLRVFLHNYFANVANARNQIKSSFINNNLMKMALLNNDLITISNTLHF